MSDQRFERVVDAYLDNSISPGDLAWLRSRINLDDGLRKGFLKKCRQHQSTQFFMVQQTLSPDWGGLSPDDLDNDESTFVPIVHNSSEEVPASVKKVGKRSSRSSRGWSIRGILDYSLLSGLICLAIVLGVSWMDRGRLYHREPSPGPGFNAAENSPLKMIYADNAFHSYLQKPQGLIIRGEESGGTSNWNFLSVKQLRWFFEQEDRLLESQWADVPTDYGVDFQKLDLLLNQSLFNARDFPHSILNPESLFQDKVGSP